MIAIAMAGSMVFSATRSRRSDRGFEEGFGIGFNIASQPPERLFGTEDWH
jgi:hypothetical protein